MLSSSDEFLILNKVCLVSCYWKWDKIKEKLEVKYAKYLSRTKMTDDKSGELASILRYLAATLAILKEVKSNIDTLIMNGLKESNLNHHLAYGDIIESALNHYTSLKDTRLAIL